MHEYNDKMREAKARANSLAAEAQAASAPGAGLSTQRIIQIQAEAKQAKEEFNHLRANQSYLQDEHQRKWASLRPVETEAASEAPAATE